MGVLTTEIVDGIYRFSSFVPEIAAPAGFTFNQYLVDGDEPLLFHCGPRHMFADVSAALSQIIPLEKLRWISFGHVESDECGSMNEWLRAAPKAQVVQGNTACMVSLNDLADRAPRPLADGETLDIGGKRLRWLDTPHVPHAWESGLMFEETTRTLFTGDLFTQIGMGPAMTGESILQNSIQTEAAFKSTALTTHTASTIRRLASLEPRTLAVMHGSCFEGDGAGELNQLADYFEGAFSAAVAQSN